MKILIYGVGAIGGFLGAHLQKTNHDIYFISRGDTLSKLKKTGLKLKSILGDQSYTDIKIDKTLPREIIFDIIIISVKLLTEGFITIIRLFIWCSLNLIPSSKSATPK